MVAMNIISAVLLFSSLALGDDEQSCELNEKNQIIDESPVRQTSNGPVEGITLTSSLGQKYYAFKGIPFAEPPITGKDHTGEYVDRRFKAPVPLKRTWNTNLKVSEYGDACIPSEYSMNDSNHPDMFKRSENCLFLNIYEPVGGKEIKSVLVWIHGGGFTNGNATDAWYGPDFLLSEDNIVVTLQYRVGIFGFLNLGTPEYSGNMGLKDQQLALKWIYQNIAHFSGNKNEILLFGESAGSASVGFHLINEESSKYFNRAFLSSSTVFSHYALATSNHFQRMQEFVKIYDKMKLIEYLKTADSGFLSTQYPFDFPKILLLPFVPTIESSNSVNPFLTKSPKEIYETEMAAVKDVMFSFSSKEILFFRPNFIGKKDPILMENIEESDVDLPFEGFNKTLYPIEYKKGLEKLKNVYFPDLSNTDAIESGNIQLLSDIVFDDSILKGVIMQSIANKNDHKNTFLFRFSMSSEISLIKTKTGINYDGATHADDLCYYFYCRQLDEYNLYDQHLKQKDDVYDAIMRMVKIITNFARTGNPSLEGDTPFKACGSSDVIYCQEISNSPRSSVTDNIKEQLHYETWREIENIYNNLQKK